MNAKLRKAVAARSVPLPSPSEARELRRSVGLSGAELAKVLGVSRTTLWQWEAGQIVPRNERRDLYAKVLSELRDLGDQQ